MFKNVKKFRILKIFVVKNRNEDKTLKNRIIIYSAIKIIANDPLLYSVLNPDTNSLSPSAKSKGVRFNSAIIENTHKITEHKNIT